MDKTAIKNFSIWARNKLIADITYKAGLLGVTEEGIKDALPQSTQDAEFYDIGTKKPYAIHGEEIKQRKELVSAIKRKATQLDYKDAYRNVVEEVAYTWFNRLIAIRFMEVNDYMPAHIRVLSSASKNKLEPDLVTTPFDAEHEFTQTETEKIMQMKNDNQVDALFRFLFIKQCNALNKVLPELFEATNDYSELLLNISFIDREGVVCHLVNDIEEVDFDVERGGQVEIIGWLYQYYISEKHEEIIDPLHGKVIAKEDVPAATQLFTTDWVVKYLIDNSLGKFWIERNPQSNLKEKLEYLIIPKCGHFESVNDYISPEDIKVLDPCMGSGHFLVYAFEVLMHIYEECGYTSRDAAKSILQNNLYGLDIDDRAFQMSYFALLMKARKYNRRILNGEVTINLHSIQESNNFNINHLNYIGAGYTENDKNDIVAEIKAVLEAFKDGKEYGSIISVPKCNWGRMQKFLQSSSCEGQISFDTMGVEKSINKLLEFIDVAKVIENKYHVVATNPPYMNKYDNKLKDYLFAHFKDVSSDLFSVFIMRNLGYCKDSGYAAYMTPNVWMFIVSYQKLREYIIENKQISNMIQMAKGAFFKEATVDICAFILQNKRADSKGQYIRLEDFKGDMEVQKVKVLEAIASDSCEYMYEIAQQNFKSIQGYPIAYWVSKTTFDVFKNSKYTVAKYAENEGKNVTTKNSKYILNFWEIEKDKIGAFDKKWLPCATGGDYRKWYGNIVSVIDWSPEARNFYKVNPAGRIIREEFWDMSGITWGKISSAASSFRVLSHDQIYQETAILQAKEEDSYFVLALLNSKPASYFLEFLSPTVNFQLQDICSIPVPEIDEQVKLQIIDKAKQCISICKSDWDNYELSMDYRKHPLVGQYRTIEEAFTNWEEKCEKRFQELKCLEEDINLLFIQAYGFSDDLCKEVEDKSISVRKADLQREIKSLLSYAIGCMFGRYSLDKEGVVYANKYFNPHDYISYHPDNDGIIPILDEEYTADDIVSRLCQWLKVAYHEETLEVNLDYIAKALGKKDGLSRDVIRKYLINDFFKDHCTAFSFGSSGKKPIYWLFDSGKQNGFKALVYLHSYNENTIGNLRVDYLHRMERIYESEINRMQDTIDNSSNAREVTAATKRKEKLQKQLKECQEYDEKIGHLALSRIYIDLDDGVKVNYEKVQTASDGKKYQVLARI